MLDAIQRHPHARAVLGAAFKPGGHPSHAYLFYGPSGSGAVEAARAFATELLTDGSGDRDALRRRVADGVHPDLTWVKATGAAEMLIADIDEPVVAAATRTPFEADRRVFVIDGAERMNAGAANRLLKTLEEPPPFVHLILLAGRIEDVLGTIRSRCLPVRFEAASSAAIAARLVDAGSEPSAADAAARLALGDARCGRLLVTEEGKLLRAAAEHYLRAAIAGELLARPWQDVLKIAARRGGDAAAAVTEQAEREAEVLPQRERKRSLKEAETAARRVERRVGTETIDLALRISSLWLRDLLCTLHGAAEVVCHSDRRGTLAADLQALLASPDSQCGSRLAEAVSVVEEARTMLMFNPTEDLLLETLALRIGRTLKSR